MSQVVYDIYISVAQTFSIFDRKPRHLLGNNPVPIRLFLDPPFFFVQCRPVFIDKTIKNPGAKKLNEETLSAFVD